ncbi:MAG: hypothetical protein E3J94_07180 [Desulfobacteraceae bacterium]|nr:MAG: hypothetical protein E3J94_07180 [Desulfobacteraceae bacterium]
MSTRKGKPITAEAKEQKHMSLISARYRVRKALRMLKELLSDVGGSTFDEKDKEPDEVTPSLVGVLNHTGAEISELADQIISITDELRDNIL